MRRMTPLSGIFSILLDTKDHYFILIPTTRGSKFNIMVEWENGETTTQPLSVIATNDPVMCAIDEGEHDPLDTKGWKHFRNWTKRENIS
jgi:hypothetical protein